MFIGLVLVGLAGCKDNKKKPDDKPVKPSKPTFTVQFNGDSAYQFVQDQVDFGPRVPGSMSHGICANYLENKLKQYCDTAMVQFGSATDYKGNPVEIKNIIGSIHPEKTKRILLCAHWDTRPQADEDKKNPTEPADGANDGASGVGVLLEVARQLQIQKPDAGVDIVLFDAEDMGDRQGSPNSWCLGSQYWSKKPHKQNYVARFGILLDMVGPKDAVFAIEMNSWQYAQPYVKQVWRTASELGHGKHFVNYQGGSLVDDHVFINRILGIPTLDIIHYNVSDNSGFGDFWHTHKDNMSSIDKETLSAVGETVFKVVMDL
ncbi:MAG: M28 family peptidase [Bacteroidia bacterium]|nr:M28 family peptidase [Bacteroidia bacterium]